MFQYIICCWFKYFDFYFLFLSVDVSIHYMLLVQLFSNILLIYIQRFQYIICCWFKSGKTTFQLPLEGFNTLYVVGSSNAVIRFKLLNLFQYIICCWFNWFVDGIFSNLCKFQYIICCWFNLLNQIHPRKTNLFQYIICCWFKKHRY